MEKQTTKAAPLTEEQLLKKEADLTVKSEQLAKDRETFEAEKAQLATDREAFETEKADFAVEKTTAEPEEIVPGLSFEIESEKFKFIDSAPKTILFDGKARTQKDLIKDKKALLQLTSNQSLIEKIQ